MIKKQDFILAAVFIAAGIIMMLCIRFTRSNGHLVTVFVEGRLICTKNLDKDESYIIETDNGTNTLVIKDGAAYVSEADCPDKLCEKMGSISKNGENIVCVPHKVVIEVSDGDKSDYDIK